MECLHLCVKGTHTDVKQIDGSLVINLNPLTEDILQQTVSSILHSWTSGFTIFVQSAKIIHFKKNVEV